MSFHEVSQSSKLIDFNGSLRIKWTTSSHHIYKELHKFIQGQIDAQLTNLSDKWFRTLGNPGKVQATACIEVKMEKIITSSVALHMTSDLFPMQST